MKGRPLRILMDARMLVGRFSGVARVVTRLVAELSKREGLRIIALCARGARDERLPTDGVEIIESSFTREDRSPYQRWRWEQANLPRLISEAGADVFHATWNSGVPRRAGAPSVLTIHDLIPWDDPRAHFATATEGWIYRHAVRTSARRAVAITTVSEYSRGKVLAKLHLPADKVACVPNGVDLPATKTPPAISDPPYVLYVGGQEPRKNLAGLLLGIQRYWERFGPTLELRLTGRSATLPTDAGQALLRFPPNALVRFLGDVDDQELARQYRSARALLLLSHEEGFGLPVIEAMANGCPVVASACSALPEIVGDAGILVDPDDAAQISEAIFSLTGPSDFRDAMINRGLARAATFSWTAVADRMEEIYYRVAQRPNGDAPPPEPSACPETRCSP